ncbi:MAG: peptidase [Bdellovibrio sp. CG10_big_fil_rev_8_21_14_0_10_47_8]|nr:MAG: peptidase [Bdellovibrio sp. CG10_big_fil_rev_8_21_14_0_10_47_8]
MIPVLDSSSVFGKLKEKGNPFWSQYFAFYSSWWGGIVQDPSLMLLPMDDHMVHRGDGVFEALKAVDRKVFLMDAHLQRLQSSAEKIGLSLPWTLEDAKEIILQTLKVANQSQALVRVFLSRGPGGFTTNPYDSVGAQFYVAITELKSLPETKYEVGVKIGRSQIPCKDSWMAQVKSCNYLPNVMMKKEAVDRGLDFTVGFDPEGFLTESSTENIVLVDAEGILVQPPLKYILKGTTMTRALQLAKDRGFAVEQRRLSEEDIFSAREVMMIGTTLDVLPVTEYEGKKISEGRVGAVAKELRQMVQKDLSNGTPF